MTIRRRSVLIIAAGMAFTLMAMGVSRESAVLLPMTGLLVLFLAILLYSQKKGLGGVYSICLGQPPVVLLAMVNPVFSLVGELVVIGLGVGTEIRTWSAGEGYLLLGFLLAAGIAGAGLLLPVHAGPWPLLVLALALAGTGLVLLNEQRINLRFKGGNNEG
jgi:hypothetical protein